MKTQSHILMVEDHDDYRNTLCRSMEMLGRNVIAVTSAEAAMDVLNRERISLLLTDIHLGRNSEMSGIDLAKRVAAMSPEIEIVLSSAAGYMVSEKLDFKFSFIPKLCNADTLLSALQVSDTSTRDRVTPV